MSRLLGLLPAVALVLVFGGRARAEGEVLTLTKAIEIGKQRAPEIREARTNAYSERAQDAFTRANYYPTLTSTFGGQGQLQRSVTPEFDVQNNNVFFPTIVTNSFSPSAAVNGQWTLYDFGKTGGSVANADGQYASAVATVHATELTITANVAYAYMNLVYAEKIRDVARQTLEQRERLAALASGLVKAGLQPPLEELRARSRAEASRRDLARVEGNALDGRAVLAALLALDPQSNFQAAAPRLSRPRLTVKQATQEADHLPAIAADVATVDSKKGSVTAAVGRWLPTIAVQATATYEYTKVSNLPPWLNSGSAAALLTVTETLFDPSIAPFIEASKFNVDNAQATTDQARRDAGEEAVRALWGLDTAESMLERARKAAEEAAIVLAVVQARYMQGLASPLDLIDGESADAAARTTLAQDELNYALAIVRVYIATGRRIEERP